MSVRTGTVDRKTKETDVRVELSLSPGESRVTTGLGFLDHMLLTLAKHMGATLDLRCTGDLEIDDHHTVEDSALALGTALDQALGDRAGIRRFGSAYAPLDEALARAVVDLSGRPFAAVQLELKRDRIGAVACENLEHALQSLASAARLTLHVDVLKGRNDHHRAEAAFKATALALREAVERDGREGIPSTKGTLSEVPR